MKPVLVEQPALDFVQQHKVAVSGPSNRRIITSLRNTIKSFHTDSYMTIPVSNIPSTFFQSNSTPYKSYLPSKLPNRLGPIVVVFTVAVSSNSLVLAPVTEFFERILLKDKNDKILQTMVPDQLLLNNILECEQSDLQLLFKNLNIRADYRCQNSSIPSGESRTFILPLTGVFTDFSTLNWVNSSSDLCIEFYSKIPTVSGSGTLTLSSMNLVCPTETLPANEMVSVMKSGQIADINRMGFLEPVVIQNSGQTITAGGSSRIDLTSFGNGHYAGLLVHYRPDNVSNTSNGLWSKSFLPSNTTFDIQNNSSNSILNSGQPISWQIYRDYGLWNHVNNDFYQRNNIAVIPFCRDLKSAMRGICCGSMKFNSAKETLVINHPSAGTAGVFSCVISSTALDQGVVKIEFGGCMTAPLAYNTSTANLKVAMDALASSLSYKGTKLGWTFSAKFDAAATITMTVDTAGVLIDEKDWPKVHVFGTDGGVSEASSAVSYSTPAIEGSNGSSQTNMTITVVGLKYKVIDESNGFFTASDLVA